MARLIGFSTGAIARGRYREALAVLQDLSVRAVELSALREEELEPLILDLPALDLEPFEYVSIHAPSRFASGSERRTANLLRQAATERGFHVVVHPDAIQAPEAWSDFGPLLLIENMDRRKSTGRTAAELVSVFQLLPEARLCFDIAHARQVDPTMTVAYEILREFGDRLAEVHISDVSTSSDHGTLSYMAEWDFSEIAHLIPNSVPAIVESKVSPENVLSETERVRRALDPAGGRLAVRENPSAPG